MPKYVQEEFHKVVSGVWSRRCMIRFKIGYQMRMKSRSRSTKKLYINIISIIDKQVCLFPHHVRYGGIQKGLKETGELSMFLLFLLLVLPVGHPTGLYGFVGCIDLSYFEGLIDQHPYSSIIAKPSLFRENAS